MPAVDRALFAFCHNPQCDLHTVKVEVGCRDIRVQDDTVPHGSRLELRHRYVHYGQPIFLCTVCKGAVDLFSRRYVG